MQSQKVKMKEELLLPEEYSFVGICRIKEKSRTHREMTPFHGQRYSNTITFKSKR